MAQFIQGAIKHPGSLRKYAEEHGKVMKNGNVDLGATKAYIEKNESGMEKTRRLRQVNLASTLKRLRA